MFLYPRPKPDNCDRYNANERRKVRLMSKLLTEGNNLKLGGRTKTTTRGYQGYILNELELLKVASLN